MRLGSAGLFSLHLLVYIYRVIALPRLGRLPVLRKHLLDQLRVLLVDLGEVVNPHLERLD